MSSTDDVTYTTGTNEATLQMGRVKWFNNKAGYGFITVTSGQKSGSDIFVHHSAINVESQQYKYLVQGEYVEFKLVCMKEGKHEFQASEVSGINSGKLMCETRRDFRMTRTSYNTDSEVPEETKEEPVRTPKQVRHNRVRGEGPRESQVKDWTLVKKSSSNTTRRPRTTSLTNV
jgi:CspA family cold shock protein